MGQGSTKTAGRISEWKETKSNLIIVLNLINVAGPVLWGAWYGKAATLISDNNLRWAKKTENILITVQKEYLTLF